MTHFVARYLLAILITAAIAWLIVVPSRAQGELYLYGDVMPPTAGVAVRVIQPGGVARDVLTDERGAWGVGVSWRAGTYTLTCARASEGYAFAVPAGQALSGPWVFQLAEPGTATPTRTALATVTPLATTPPATATSRPTWQTTATAFVLPTAERTATATVVLPTPAITPLVMVLQSTSGQILGEIWVELWMGEDGEVELINLSGAVWRQ